MSRRFIAGIAAVAITITAFGSAPADADDSFAAVIATAVGAAVVDKIVNDRLNNGGIDRATRDIYNRTYYPSNPPVQPRINNSARVQQPRFDNRAGVQPRPLPRRANRAVLPSKCLHRSSNRQVFAKSCLKKNYGFTRSLPRDCEVKFRANGKKKKGYRAGCLDRAGYRPGRY